MFRVYDIKKERWIDNVYMTPDEELYEIKKNIFGVSKFRYLSNAMVDDTDDMPTERYVVHRDIELYDMNDTLIYQGDIVRANVADDKVVNGLVTYAHELASYIILCYDNDEYYVLGESVTTRVEVIGNILENKELLLKG